MIEVEVYLLVDDLGAYVSVNTAGFRIVTLEVKVPLPEAVELAVEVPASGSASLACV